MLIVRAINKGFDFSNPIYNVDLTFQCFAHGLNGIDCRLILVLRELKYNECRHIISTLSYTDRDIRDAIKNLAPVFGIIFILL